MNVTGNNTMQLSPKLQQETGVIVVSLSDDFPSQSERHAQKSPSWQVILSDIEDNIVTSFSSFWWLNFDFPSLNKIWSVLAYSAKTTHLFSPIISTDAHILSLQDNGGEWNASPPVPAAPDNPQNTLSVHCFTENCPLQRGGLSRKKQGTQCVYMHLCNRVTVSFPQYPRGGFTEVICALMCTFGKWWWHQLQINLRVLGGSHMLIHGSQVCLLFWLETRRNEQQEMVSGWQKSSSDNRNGGLEKHDFSGHFLTLSKCNQFERCMIKTLDFRQGKADSRVGE